MTRTISIVLADVYVAGEDDGEYWFEGEPARVEVEAADGAIRVGVTVDGREQEIAGLYLSPSGARDLLVGLGSAIGEYEARAEG